MSRDYVASNLMRLLVVLAIVGASVPVAAQPSFTVAYTEAFYKAAGAECTLINLAIPYNPNDGTVPTKRSSISTEVAQFYLVFYPKGNVPADLLIEGSRHDRSWSLAEKLLPPELLFLATAGAPVAHDNVISGVPLGGHGSYRPWYRLWLVIVDDAGVPRLDGEADILSAAATGQLRLIEVSSTFVSPVVDW